MFRSENIFLISTNSKLEDRHGFKMIYDRWNHSEAPPPLLSYNIVRPDTIFFDIVPKKRSIQDKNAEEWNNMHATYFPKDASLFFLAKKR